mmetsp:Transcript_23214/g.45177  ORF Transcript_23214/g.45177 Transcript_23214/m.45177 type:complete len:209 (+) Transcript_23214:151-777(+)
MLGLDMDRLARELEPADQCLPIRVDLKHVDSQWHERLQVAVRLFVGWVRLVEKLVEIDIADRARSELGKREDAVAHLRFRVQLLLLSRLLDINADVQVGRLRWARIVRVRKLLVGDLAPHASTLVVATLALVTFALVLEAGPKPSAARINELALAIQHLQLHLELLVSLEQTAPGFVLRNLLVQGGRRIFANGGSLDVVRGTHSGSRA